MTADVVRKVPFVRWVLAGVTVVSLLLGALYMKANHGRVLAPVTPIAQTVAPVPLPAPAPSKKKPSVKAKQSQPKK